MYQYWLDGNREGLEKIVFEGYFDYYTDREIKLIEDYNDKMITKRNITMTDTLINYFENKQNVFFVVGIGHVIGEDGIVNLLKNKGYAVNLK